MHIQPDTFPSLGKNSSFNVPVGPNMSFMSLWDSYFIAPVGLVASPLSFFLSQRILLCWVGPRLSSVLLGPLHVCVLSRALLGCSPALVLFLRLSRFSTGTPKRRPDL